MSSLRVLSLYCNMYGLFGNVDDARQRKWHDALLTPGGLVPVSNGTTDLWWDVYWVRQVSMYYRQRAWQSRG